MAAPAPLPELSSLPQAASEMVKRAAAAMAVNLAERMRCSSLRLFGALTLIRGKTIGGWVRSAVFSTFSI
jgi:hypothetical protein